MNKQELIEKLKRLRDRYPVDDSHEGVRQGLLIAIGMIDQLLEPTEPEKVVIPQFVANYIELCKGWNGDRQAYTEDNSGLWFALNGDSQGMPNSVSDWLFNEEKVETFARAWLEGYKVEKEKLYRIELPSGHIMCMSGGKDKASYSYMPIVYTDTTPNFLFTEAAIKAIDERYWPFAVEVAE